MDPHAKSFGTMVGTLARNRQRWIVAVAVLPSLTLAGLLLSMLPAYALPPAERDAGLQAPHMTDAPPAERIVVAARVRGAGAAAAGARLLNNGTRSRESREETDNTSEKAAGDRPADAAPAPTPAPTASQPARPAATATPDAEQTEQMKSIAGLGRGRDPSDIECVANCPRSTPTVRIGGSRQALDPSLTEGGMECIAGCYGVNMTSVIVERNELSALSPQGEARGSGPGHRITVLRSVTRTKSYTPAN